MFDVQTVLMIAEPQGTSHFSGANVFHHYHGVQIKVGILVSLPFRAACVLPIGLSADE